MSDDPLSRRMLPSSRAHVSRPAPLACAARSASCRVHDTWLPRATDATSPDTQLFAKLIAARDVRNELALLGLQRREWDALLARHFARAVASSQRNSRCRSQPPRRHHATARRLRPNASRAVAHPRKPRRRCRRRTVPRHDHRPRVPAAGPPVARPRSCRPRRSHVDADALFPDARRVECRQSCAGRNFSPQQRALSLGLDARSRARLPGLRRLRIIAFPTAR